MYTCLHVAVWSTHCWNLRPWTGWCLWREWRGPRPWRSHALTATAQILPTARWRQIGGTARRSSARRQTGPQCGPASGRGGACLGRWGSGPAPGQSASGQPRREGPAGRRWSSPVWALGRGPRHYNSVRKGRELSSYSDLAKYNDHP